MWYWLRFLMLRRSRQSLQPLVRKQGKAQNWSTVWLSPALFFPKTSKTSSILSIYKRATAVVVSSLSASPSYNNWPNSHFIIYPDPELHQTVLPHTLFHLWSTVSSPKLTEFSSTFVPQQICYCSGGVFTSPHLHHTIIDPTVILSSIRIPN